MDIIKDASHIFLGEIRVQWRVRFLEVKIEEVVTLRLRHLEGHKT